jgi:hypothetical protein
VTNWSRRSFWVFRLKGHSVGPLQIVSRSVKDLKRLPVLRGGGGGGVGALLTQRVVSAGSFGAKEERLVLHGSVGAYSLIDRPRGAA